MNVFELLELSKESVAASDQTTNFLASVIREQSCIIEMNRPFLTAKYASLALMLEGKIHQPTLDQHLLTVAGKIVAAETCIFHTCCLLASRLKELGYHHPALDL